MNLLDQIIESGTMNTPPPLSSVLRQCILLSSHLKVPVLRTWAERELNGYDTAENLPDYRIIGAGAFGAFQGFRVHYPQRPIPPSLLEPELRSKATEVYLLDPVATYEGMKGDGGMLRFPWPGDMIGYYQSKLLEDSILISAWQDISQSSIVGMLDTIRTRVLTTVIDIKADFESTGVDLNHLNVKPDSPESEKAQQIVINNILSGNFYFGDTQITQLTQNIKVGDWESLQTALEKSGIGEAESHELRGTLKNPDGIKGWVTRNAGKVLDKGLEVGTTLGAKVLTDFISRYLRLPA